MLTIIGPFITALPLTILLQFVIRRRDVGVFLCLLLMPFSFVVPLTNNELLDAMAFGVSLSGAVNIWTSGKGIWVRKM